MENNGIEEYHLIRKMLIEERRMREKVFRERPKVRQRKVAEIDQAGLALNRLAKLAGLDISAPAPEPTPAETQLNLIDLPKRGY